MVQQLTEHLLSNQFYEPLQSGFRHNHSTETALAKIVNNLLFGLDTGSISVLVLLDLSAAFDTVDHQILLERMENNFGISGTALQWFRSYLSDRSQCVHSFRSTIVKYSKIQSTAGFCPRPSAIFPLHAASRKNNSKLRSNFSLLRR